MVAMQRMCYWSSHGGFTIAAQQGGDDDVVIYTIETFGATRLGSELRYGYSSGMCRVICTNQNFGVDLDWATNELVIKVQLDEAIYLKINNKVPSLRLKLDRSNLNLHYPSRYLKEILYAYERLLLDAIEGERRLFIHSGMSDVAKTGHVNVPTHKKFNPLNQFNGRGPIDSN
ncbi:hypothetical protein VIGAN_02209000 [Vigna angularis var. angularis]|uniref:Glucose-6-phosphate dehydrogenase C-terminal domain-containing protein n=1 Tax=Vigna angularis var. angularis TaxID=157739 RepID=A0A0S3RF37_PHAAN|nr:hypothetical protein VIGAN_02209000 [Vigna angularis var. angularis]